METFLASLGKVAEMYFQRTIILNTSVLLAQEIQLKIALMMASNSYESLSSISQPAVQVKRTR